MKKIYAFTILTIAILFANEIKAQVSKRDSLALVNLYDSTFGDSWRHNKNWLNGPVSTWYGITVVDTSVTSVVLGTNGLGGTLPACIGDLSNLNTLYLNDNHIHGTIPETIGNLTNLQYLSFYHNNIKGGIPVSIGNCINLLQLSLSYNQLQVIPTSLCHCINLYWLYLDNNSFKSLPDSIGNLSRLFFLDVSYNDLKGSIPQSIGGLVNLVGLNLSINSLTGPIPESIGDLASVTSINLRHNNLTGEIPSSIGNLSKLQYLDLSYNSIAGTIPGTVGNLYNIQEIYLYNNKLTDKIPASIGKLDSLQELNLQSNKLTGNIPASLAHPGNLHVLYLSDNQLTGSIPPEFADPKKHISLIVSGNHLSQIGNVNFPNFHNSQFYAAIDHNWFTFDGLEFIASSFPSITYSPQSKINIHQRGNYLTVYAGGTLNNNIYQWSKDGIVIKTKQGDSAFLPAISGNYTVKVTNSVATKLTLYGDTISFNTSNISPAIAANQINNNSFSIYPNPVKTIATISFITKGNCIIKLADVSGNIIQTKTVSIKGLNTLQLDVSKYASGIYFVSILGEGKQIQTLQLNKE
ncbi:MAG: T9SS type A sorting domain-containing protein [Parafilimonas sp.]